MDSLSYQPIISVITCFLNVEEYIEEAIASVLAQHYLHWELLLIDDGSTDGSTLIAKKYAALWPGKIIYLEHANHLNKGLGASRNVGLLESKGDLVTFLDADDVLLPTMLAHLFELLQKYSVSMVCEATEYWCSWNNAGNDIIIPIGTEQNRSYAPPDLLINLYPLGIGAAPCMCGVLVYREAMLRYGGFDESFPGMYEDQTILVKLYLNETVYISSGCHNRYRQRAGSLVHTSHGSGNYLQVRLKFLLWFEKYLSEHGPVYPKVIAALQDTIKSVKKSRRQCRKYVVLSAIKRVLRPYTWWRK